MKTTRIIQKLGCSLTICVPADAMRQLRLRKGDTLQIDVRNDELVMTPVRAPCQTTVPEPAAHSLKDEGCV